jgi:dephospho-CoA kinase
VVGLVGGIASGKSTVAGELEHLGAARIDADAIAHEVLREPEVLAALRERFGERIGEPGGGVDRRALGRIVFESPEALRILERIVHPRIRRRIAERLASQPPGAVVVLDAALLLESGLDRVCDVIVLVEASPEVRERRAVRDRGWPEGEVPLREGHQRSVAEKRTRADVVLANDGSGADLRREVASLWERLAAMARRDDGSRRKP